MAAQVKGTRCIQALHLSSFYPHGGHGLPWVDPLDRSQSLVKASTLERVFRLLMGVDNHGSFGLNMIELVQISVYIQN